MRVKPRAGRMAGNPGPEAQELDPKISLNKTTNGAPTWFGLAGPGSKEGWH